MRRYAADSRPILDVHSAPGQESKVIAAREATKTETLDEIKAELMSLIGLDPVKRDFLSIPICCVPGSSGGKAN